jgi:hypothetical protein
MTRRRGWVLCWLLCVGCQAAGPGTPGGEDERPLGFFESTLTGLPQAARSHLSQAAALLEKGEETAAAEHLAIYLTHHSEHFEVRVHYAELLFRRAQLGLAREEFARSIAQAQERGDQTLRQRLHCHGMLLEIAEIENDQYASHFHRGVGLYLLALERSKLPDPAGQLPVEGLLCRAAAELAVARAERPDEARPCWYLHQVWSALGQQGPATRWLERASAAAPFTSLTPAEQRGLQLAASARPLPALRPF